MESIIPVRFFGSGTNAEKDRSSGNWQYTVVAGKAKWKSRLNRDRMMKIPANLSFARATASKLLPPWMKSAIRRLQRRPQRVDRGSVLKIGFFGGFQVAYRGGTADENVLEHSFDHDIFFAGVPDYLPAETDVILDVGAHIGTFAILAASKVSRGAVYAIEACEDTFNYLRINAALNRLENLSTFHLALYDRPGKCTLNYDSGNWGHSIVSHLSNRGEVVDCCTLQQFFDDNHIGNCSFIKFNCEGAEFPILLSSPTSLLRRVGKMLVLYHCDLWTKNTLEELLTHLGASGFECIVTNRGEKRGWIIATNSCRVDYEDARNQEEQ
jgi:FkbM family methyltransferase